MAGGRWQASRWRHQAAEPEAAARFIIDLQSLFRILKRGKKLIFLIVLSSTFITGIYSIKTKPKWIGSFNIVVKKNSEDTANASMNPIANFNNIVNDTNETERLILQSPSVLMPVFDFVKNHYHVCKLHKLKGNSFVSLEDN